jgi:hypothetical protein
VCRRTAIVMTVKLRSSILVDEDGPPSSLLLHMFYLTRVSYDNNTYEITIRTTEQAIKQIQFVMITISRFIDLHPNSASDLPATWRYKC